MIKKFLIHHAFVFAIFLSFAPSVQAGEFTIRPFLIDEELEQNEVIQKNILLTNDAQHRKYVVFATVNEISVDTAGEIKEFVTPSQLDMTDSPTSWIEVTRGRLEIPPGENITVPLTLRVNPHAKPGDYHVFLGFVPARNRPLAEDIAMKGEADGVILKMTISDSRKDSLKIDSFTVDKFVTGDDGQVKIELQNFGDLTSVPQGEVIFYNSSGEEVSAIDINTDGVEIKPGEIKKFSASVPFSGKLGRYKSNLVLNYGVNQAATLQDTTYFYMLSLPLLLLVFGGILLVAILLVLLLRKSLHHNDYEDHDGHDVAMYVKEGHEANPKDHDIDLKNKTE